VPLETDLKRIKHIAKEKETENDRFKSFLKQQDVKKIDQLVHQLNEAITPEIDCTICGNCCKSLMINVTREETVALAAHLNLTVNDLKEKYIEESDQGQMVINTIPCHFLEGNRCSIYQQRFTECREFPHLHKSNFTGRLFGTFMYYEMCPIIFNVVEKLKENIHFK
jgi:uncharacterized protein